MEQGGLSRWLLVGLLVLLGVVLVPRWCSSEHGVAPLRLEPNREMPSRGEKLCELRSDSFRAELSSTGASIKHFELLPPKYQKNGVPIDLSTTPDVPLRRQLHFHWRNPAAHDAAAEKWETLDRFYDARYWQVAWDVLSFELAASDGRSCRFTYRDDDVEIEKIVAITDRPYELKATATIKNLAQEKRRHALTVHTTAWRTDQEVKGGMFRVSPYITHVECVMKSGDATRLQPDAFDAKKFESEPFKPNELQRGDWYSVPGDVDLAAVSNAYFSHAVLPLESPVAPQCQLQIEKWGRAGDPLAGSMYRARLAYPKVELTPNQSAKYEVLTYIGPKERSVLAAAGQGRHQLSELIDLGFFSAIAKVLVAFLLRVYSVIPNWGIAIIVLTITARVLLFPLSIPMIKSSLKMRELKPEIDALNEKYKDDPQQRGLAQMELWRKHKVNPMKGCVPQLATLPVWFALYTTLQTAVELYNIPFLWFPDLSEPDPYFVLPFIIGATSFVQQKIMPMQAGDPAQQKMMLYMMPAMFTVFMLFLPAGLGVYMFTNSLLGIAQQQGVEWTIRRRTAAGAGGDGGGSAAQSGKPKAAKAGKSGKSGKAARRAGGAGEDSSKLSKLADGLLGKGKA